MRTSCLTNREGEWPNGQLKPRLIVHSQSRHVNIFISTSILCYGRQLLAISSLLPRPTFTAAIGVCRCRSRRGAACRRPHEPHLGLTGFGVSTSLK